MQTFVPYANAARSAQVLDYRRLGKQRVECKQIYNALVHGGGWANHPAVRMWVGHERYLVWYWIVMCQEWLSRGYNDNLLLQAKKAYIKATKGTDSPPNWWGGKIHVTHKRALLAKNYKHYSQYWPRLTPVIDYYWPV
jgi:hypothetical protein